MTYDYKEPIRPMFWVPETQTVAVRRSGLHRAAKSGRTFCTTS